MELTARVRSLPRSVRVVLTAIVIVFGAAAIRHIVAAHTHHSCAVQVVGRSVTLVLGATGETVAGECTSAIADSGNPPQLFAVPVRSSYVGFEISCLLTRGGTSATVYDTGLEILGGSLCDELERHGWSSAT